MSETEGRSPLEIHMEAVLSQSGSPARKIEGAGVFTGTLPAVIGYSRTGTPLMNLTHLGDDGWEITIAGCHVDGPLIIRGTGRMEMDGRSAILAADGETGEEGDDTHEEGEEGDDTHEETVRLGLEHARQEAAGPGPYLVPPVWLRENGLL